MHWLKRWWPALLWAVVIWCFSTGAFTSVNTELVIVPVLRWLFPHASHHMLLVMHHYIRKGAHFTEYFIFSLLVSRGIRAGRHGARAGWAIAAVVLVACYASLDEFHQAFVPGRQAAVADVLLDISGGVVAQVVAVLCALGSSAREARRGSISKADPSDPASLH
jgi:VanZ family protein